MSVTEDIDREKKELFGEQGDREQRQSVFNLEIETRKAMLSVFVRGEKKVVVLTTGIRIRVTMDIPFKFERL